MRFSLLPLSLLLLVAASVSPVSAGDYTHISSRSRAHGSLARRNNGNFTSPWKLKDYYRAESFLDPNQWEFFSNPDPTHGMVNYQTREAAIDKKLAYVQTDGTTILKVDDFTDVPVGQFRDSVRINTKKTYTGGLFIGDFWSMPHGCSIWPAYWTVGPGWPAGGEIDILEGVHKGPKNHMTLHTSAGCTMTKAHETQTLGSTLVHDRCESSGNDNRGCGFSDPDERSYGHQFNILGGGAFALLWEPDGIRIWRFFRPEIPADIKKKKPNPDSWGQPAAFFPADNCDISKHFYDHVIVLDTTLCGDLGNPTYAAAGCPGTCAERVAKGANFKWAKWQINYIAVYDTK